MSCQCLSCHWEFLRFCRLYDTRVDQLVSFVKYFSIKNDIIGSGSGVHLNSYTVVLMVIFFLQHQNILPSVEDLQINMREDLCCGWNFAFNKEYEFVTDIGNNSSNVSKLLTDFFRFYIHFPYETHIICLLVGQPVKRSQVQFQHAKHFVRIPIFWFQERQVETKQDSCCSRSI